MKLALSRKNLWDATPRWGKEAVGKVLSVLPREWLYGRRFRGKLRFVREAQWWSRDMAEEYQLRRLQTVVRLAYERSKYYRKSFDRAGVIPDDIRSLEDISRLPFIDRQIVVDHLEEMAVRNFRSSDVDCVATGGTSGEPLRFYTPASRSFTEYAYLVESWRRKGFVIGSTMCVLRGRVVERDRSGLHHEYDPVLKHHYYSTFHMSPTAIAAYVAHMNSLKSFFLHAYPSSATALVGEIEAQGLEIPSGCRGVILESETVFPDQKARIERVLQVPVLACYGHSEKLVLAAWCEESSLYHVWPTYGLCELVDKSGRAVGDVGIRGEIVGTGFFNDVVPFIRYRTGDYARFAGYGCDHCGRQHMLLSEVEGRWPQGGLKARDGTVISMTALNMHDDTLRGVREYQFWQSRPGEAILAVVPSMKLKEDKLLAIANGVNARLQGQVCVTVRVCSKLRKTLRGKQLRVIHDGRDSNAIGAS